MGFTRSKNDLINALLGAAYFFLLLCAYYMLKPLRDSSFLSEFHPNAKPLFNLVTMVILFGAASLYSTIVKQIQGFRFLVLFYTVVVVNLILFWIFFQISPRLTGAVFYAWLATANVFLVTIFWTQINSSFTGRNDKLFYVVIGLGGGIGAAFGGKIVSVVVPHIGSNNLILAGIAVLSLAFLCAWLMIKRSGKQCFLLPTKSLRTDNFQGLLKSRYAVCILSLVIIGQFVQSLFDYQLTTMVAKHIEASKDAYSIFYGSLYWKMNAFGFIAQILLGPLLLLTLGPARGLFLVPIIIVSSALALILDGSLMTMEWTFIIFAGSGYSIVQMLREQLYVPASHKVKVSYKGFIDTFGFRAGDALAAVAFVAIVSLLDWNVVNLDYLVLLSGFVAVYFLIQANNIYQRISHLERDDKQALDVAAEEKHMAIEDGRSFPATPKPAYSGGEFSQ